MKTTFLFFLMLLSTSAFCQSKFYIGFGLNQQLLKKDTGISYDGYVGYNFNEDIALNLFVTNSEMKSKDFDFNYKMDKYAVLVNYDFGKSKKSKFESVFGFSYLVIDKKLMLEKNSGLGFDLGFQTLFGLKNKLNYGFKIISTFNSIAPGGILNSGVLFRYNFK